MSLHEARARYAWLTTVLLNLVVPLFAMGCYAYVVRQLLTRRQLRIAAVAAVLLGVVGGVLLFLGIARDSAMHGVVFAFAYDTLEATNRYSDGFLRHVLVLIWTMNALAIVAPSCALVAFCSTVVRPRDRAETLGELRGRIRKLRVTLNASAALLVSGVLHMNTWLNWSAALVEDKTAREGIELVTLAVTLYWGMTFTLMIVSAFTPAMILLRDRALRLHRAEPGAKDDAEQWLVQQGFKFSVGHQLPQVAVMLTPLLAGPAASLFGALANLGQ